MATGQPQLAPAATGLRPGGCCGQLGALASAPAGTGRGPGRRAEARWPLRVPSLRLGADGWPRSHRPTAWWLLWACRTAPSPRLRLPRPPAWPPCRGWRLRLGPQRCCRGCGTGPARGHGGHGPAGHAGLGPVPLPTSTGQAASPTASATRGCRARRRPRWGHGGSGYVGQGTGPSPTCPGYGPPGPPPVEAVVAADPGGPPPPHGHAHGEAGHRVSRRTPLQA